MREKSDLFPGVAAVIAFLGMIWLLGAPLLWLSAALSAGVYVGVRFLMTGSRPLEPTPAPAPTPRALLEDIRRLTPHSPPRLQLKLGALCDKGDQLLAYFEANPLRASDSQFIVGQYLEVARTAVSRALAVRTASDEALAPLGDLILNVHDRFTALYDTLRGEDDAALASELNVLNRTLVDLDSTFTQTQGNTL